LVAINEKDPACNNREDRQFTLHRISAYA
jgi:hypothetical protein